MLADLHQTGLMFACGPAIFRMAGATTMLALRKVHVTDLICKGHGCRIGALARSTMTEPGQRHKS